MIASINSDLTTSFIAHIPLTRKNGKRTLADFPLFRYCLEIFTKRQAAADNRHPNRQQAAGAADNRGNDPDASAAEAEADSRRRNDHDGALTAAEAAADNRHRNPTVAGAAEVGNRHSMTPFEYLKCQFLLPAPRSSAQNSAQFPEQSSPSKIFSTRSLPCVKFLKPILLSGRLPTSRRLFHAEGQGQLR